MTLGEFRKITEQYDDECTLTYATSYNDVQYPMLVERVIINIGMSTESEPDPAPNIIVM